VPEPAIEQPQPIAVVSSSQPSSSRPPGSMNMFQGAVAQATGAPQKRSSSARSPSPNGQPNKTRRIDVPSGPRSMGNGAPPSGPRSLLDRMGGPPPRQPRHPNSFANDDVQARIHNVTQGGGMGQMGHMGMPPMGLNPAMMGGMEANPMMLQEMMVNQMALMAQMASSMGIMNPALGAQFPGGPGQFPPQGGFNGPGHHGGASRGRGRGRGGFNGGPHVPHSNGGLNATAPAFTPGAPPTLPIAAPTPTMPSASNSLPVGFTPPTRPLSPTLCKFGVKCSNVTCRYSHPSPVATPESGVVLSSEACEKGPECQDADCVKGHVSPAVKKGGVPGMSLLHIEGRSNFHTPAVAEHGKSGPPVSASSPCRYGAACARQGTGCPFQHPTGTQCRFGTGCTRAACTFQHPPGRVLPNTFNRGIDGSKAVTITAPPTGSIGGAQTLNKSLKFSDADKAATAAAAARADLEKKMREIEDRKKSATTAEGGEGAVQAAA
jgi:hypothetical protein